MPEKKLYKVTCRISKKYEYFAYADSGYDAIDLDPNRDSERSNIRTYATQEFNPEKISDDDTVINTPDD